MFKVPERYRVEVPGYPPGDSQNGCFVVKLRHAQVLRIILENNLCHPLFFSQVAL